MDDTTDQSKARWYVLAELGIKLISAVGLLVVGCAGWQLQRDIAADRATNEKRAAQARTYLPELRTLSELQLFASATSSMLTSTRDVAGEDLYRRSSETAFLANSLVLPGREPAASITPANSYMSRLSPRTLQMPIVCAALMFGEALAFKARIAGTPTIAGYNYISFNPSLRTLYVAVEPNSPNGIMGMSTSPQSSPCWAIWIPKKGMLVAEYNAAAEGLAGEIVENTARIARSTLAANPELADRYVDIRADVLRSTK